MEKTGRRGNGNAVAISVLYVDDEPDLLEIAKIFLESTGDFFVTTILSAQEALLSPAFVSSDAIISDYQMPGMDGIVFLKAVREQRKDVPFILFTGRGREEVVVAAINNGADFYLQKGGDPKAQFAELAHKIRQAVARRQAERDRSESEKRLLDIISFLPDATFAIDRSGTVIAWNRAMEEMTGTAAADVLGRGQEAYSRAFYNETRPMLIDLVLNKDEPFEKEKYLYTRRDGTTLTAETIFVKEGRAPVHLWGKASRLYDEKGNLTGAIESIRDITEREQAAEALRTSEEKYRLVVENSHDGIYIYRDNRLLFTNRRISELTGYTTDELQKIDMWERIHPDDRARLKESGKRRIDGGDVPPNFTARLLTRGGDVRTCEFFVSRIRYQNEPAILGILRDVTGQLKAEETRRLLKTSVDQSPEEVIWLDFEANILYVNDAACEINGYSRDEFMKMKIFDLDPDMKPEVWAASVSDLREKKHQFIISRHRCKDGRIIDVEIVAVYVRQGDREYVFSFTRDITERRRIERSLRRSEATARALTRNPLLAVALLDPDGICLDANETTIERFGKESHDIIGKPVWDLFHPAEAANRRALFARALEKKQTIRETDFRRGRWFENVLNPILDENGEVSSVVTISLDITERKKAEEALLESEAWFRSFVETSPDMIWEVNYEGRLRYISPIVTDIMGYTPEELTGQSFLVLIREQGRSSVAQAFARYTSLQGPLPPLEVPARHKDGRDLFIEVRPARMLDAEGKCAGFRGVAHDITGRKLAQAALKESEELYRILVTSVPDLIVRTDLEGNVTYINDYGLAMGGFSSPGEIVGTPVFQWFAPEDLGRVQENAKMMFERQLGPVEYTLIDRSGKRHALEINGDVLRRPDGTPTGMVFVGRDITQRKLSEESLKDSEEKYRLLADNATDIVWILNLASRRFTYISPAVIKVLGYTPQEALEVRLDEMLAPESYARAMEELEKVLELDRQGLLEHDRTWVFEFEEIRKDKSIVLTETSISILRNGRGAPAALQGITRDITQRKKADRAIRKAHQQLTLLSGITRHDILNNITVILGYLAVARGKKNTPPEMAAFIDKVEEKTRQIREQIEFTRIYEDLGSNEPRWQDIHEVTGGVPAPRGVSLTDNCTGIEVYGDVMLKNVFENLVDNSVRHGGRVTEIRIAASEKEGGLVITYEDNGDGIPDDEKEKVFERGFGKHTGLGLFLAREVLALTGITIAENGTPGKGARFVITVPKGGYRITSGQ